MERWGEERKMWLELGVGENSRIWHFRRWRNTQILHFRLFRAVGWGIMLSFPFRKEREHPDCPRGLPSVAFARRRVGGEETVPAAAFGSRYVKV